MKIFLTLLAIFFGMTCFVLAQDVQISEVATVATVNIHNAKVVSGKGSLLRVYFSLSNREYIQPDIHYSLQLIKKDENSQVIMDEKFYNDHFNLNENDSIKKEIEYFAPAYLSGEFDLWVIVRNKKGMMLALSNAGKINLNGNGQYLEVDSSSCYLSIEGEDKGKKYELIQGVDVEKNEKIIVNCNLINHFKNKIEVFPVVDTYQRVISEEKISEVEDMQSNKMSFASLEKKTVSFVLPKAKNPQAYDAIVSFTEEGGKAISNPVYIHYVLRGLSATIQNIRLDKNYYQKGDDAVAYLAWSGSADNFPSSRAESVVRNDNMFVNIVIKNRDGINCADIFSEKLDASKAIAKYNFYIKEDCFDPNISFDIKDEKGNILDKNSFFLKSEIEPNQKKIENNDPPETENVEKTNIVKIVLLILFVALIILIIIISILFLKRRGIIFSLLLLIISSFFLAGEASADTFNIVGRRGETNVTVVYAMTANLNKLEYSAGENARLDSSIVISSCHNYIYDVNVTGAINTAWQQLFYLKDTNATTLYKTIYENVPIIPGDYDVDIRDGYYLFWSGGIEYHHIPYKVGYSCTGDIPLNSILCDGDEEDLVVDTARALVPACTDSTKCEYVSTLPPAITLLVSPSNIKIGESSNVSWSFFNMDINDYNCTTSVTPDDGDDVWESVVIDNGDPDFATVTPLDIGGFTYSMSCQKISAIEPPVTDAAFLMVTPLSLVVELSASKNSVELGENFLLSWNVSGADSCSKSFVNDGCGVWANPIEMNSLGSELISPTLAVECSYSLTCSIGSLSEPKEVTVNVSEPTVTGLSKNWSETKP